MHSGLWCRPALCSFSAAIRQLQRTTIIVKRTNPICRIIRHRDCGVRAATDDYDGDFLTRRHDDTTTQRILTRRKQRKRRTTTAFTTTTRRHDDTTTDGEGARGGAEFAEDDDLPAAFTLAECGAEAFCSIYSGSYKYVMS